MIKTQRARWTKGRWRTKKGCWKVSESHLEVKQTTEAHRGREKLRELKSQHQSRRARVRARAEETEPELEPRTTKRLNDPVVVGVQSVMKMEEGIPETVREF